ncbi:MAG TPA: PsbP-related protein [Candidatus Pacearchaeota archaeon]|nr:PsbP-related protein [Candidatus Pacearchaeota archaeon]HPR79991.1 PsbP-related protein [Candidatus Pacearchaeota archaeon]
MNKKAIIFFIIALILIIGGYFLVNYDFSNTESQKENSNGYLLKDGFSIKIPEGWEETQAITGISAMIIKKFEDHEEPELKNINFRSYFAVTYDKLNGKTIKQYAEYLEEEIVAVNSNFKVDKEEALIINANESYVVEGSLSQQGADFKLLAVVIKGKEDGVWIVSFNTGKNDWDKYSGLVSETIMSFTVR